MGWMSADVLIEEPLEEELRIWNRADLEQPKRNAHTRESTAERNAAICDRFHRGDSVEALSMAFDLSERTIYRIVGL